VGATATDVLVVGAGPTGLALAAQLEAFGTGVRIVDRQLDRAHESRALAIQPRTLEVLAGLGLADQLVERGNTAVGLQLHAGGRTTDVPLFDRGLDDTAYPFLLFLSQATTEAILGDHLARRGVTVERGAELTGLDQRAGRVRCALTHRDGRVEPVEARYVVGCDGAHSTVRARAGIGFAGASYPQTFVLADLEADGLRPGAAHVYLSRAGMLFFFPLAEPAPWRLLGWPLDPAAPTGPAPSLADLQGLVDAYARDPPALHEPVWSTYFRLHHRHATAYRAGCAFVAGDAAHVHSPAGAQGMNTGIQDAVNLGWKLALVTGGSADASLLDTYEAERRPVGRDVLRVTDRAFRIATSTAPLPRFARTRIAPRLAWLATRLPAARAAGFRAASQLGVAYRHSPAVADDRPRPRRRPRPGDRLPDAPLRLDGAPTTLHRVCAGTRFTLLRTGPSRSGAEALAPRYGRLVEQLRLSRRPDAGALHDTDGTAHRRLGLDPDGGQEHVLVRPDGHVAYRARGADLGGLHAYLGRWLPGA
jgi:2-polyprenyl-6-methoxyphenol hydroxylase-like FAD-dependent oxidoreductase